MKLKLTYLMLFTMLGLVACGEDDSQSSTQMSSAITKHAVDNTLSGSNQISGISGLGAGAYTVSMGTDEDLKIGTYYQSDNDEKLLIINGEEQKSDLVFYAFPNQEWVSVVPMQENEVIDISQHEAIHHELLNLSSFSGDYHSTYGKVDIEIKIDDQGNVISGDSACKLNGKLSQTDLPNMMKYNLTSQACGDLSSNLKGYFVKDENYEPASFRLINLNSSILDLWFYVN